MVIDYLHDRVIFGALATAVVTMCAFAARTLTRSGAIAAFFAGTIAIAAGWSWGILLLSLFVSASVLSRHGEKRKTALLESVVEKGGRRDALQVAANGAVFVAAAAGFLFSQDVRWLCVGIGALAASTADTWSTEIGTLHGGQPRLIASGKTVEPGTSGGVTTAGLFGALAGAIFAAVAASLAGWPVPFAAVVAGGLAGALADSVIGAIWQSKRWCDACARSTERMIHACGTETKHFAGAAWLDNDGVNFISTVIGGLVTMLLAGLRTGI